MVSTIVWETYYDTPLVWTGLGLMALSHQWKLIIGLREFNLVSDIERRQTYVYEWRNVN